MLSQEALDYHRHPSRGKVAIRITKPTATQHDLTLAYSPGVAVPCMEIHRDVELAYEYTIKGNLVAVISNGTAVLGLGNIGAQAAKPPALNIIQRSLHSVVRFTHLGFDCSIKSTFFWRRHALICFSLAMAARTSWVSS